MYLLCTMRSGVRRLSAWADKAVAQRYYSHAARRGAAVLMEQPGNVVVSETTSQPRVPVVRDAAIAAAAGANHDRSSPAAEADARANNNPIPVRTAKALWSAAQGTAVEEDGFPTWTGLCGDLARAVLGVDAASKAAAAAVVEEAANPTAPPAGSAPAPTGSTPSAAESAPPSCVEAAYWPLCVTKPSGQSRFLAYDSAAFARLVFDKSGRGVAAGCPEAMVLMAQPGGRVLASLGDADAVEDDEAVVAYGTAASVAAPNALATATLTIADTPPPVVPIAYLLVASVKANGQVAVVAYATDASAWGAYKRLGGETPRALVGQPGNRVPGVRGANEPAAIESRGWATWLGRSARR
ncbi:hypothetical protein I4F81_012338 [Pyropia yezoensis]|uniref:Uncharacterized protein n=1 Tax=Pyropia yezoensis TaxID=2788 RepID=A0ACC3CIE2_PYRYE|nr:hypothetical protein I4F81_012338 [Neopyropia yezoensis]